MEKTPENVSSLDNATNKRNKHIKPSGNHDPVFTLARLSTLTEHAGISQ